MRVGIIMKKSFGFTISMLLVISLVLPSNVAAQGPTNQSESKSDGVIITNESYDADKVSSTGSFNLQEINENISVHEDLSMEAYKIDMNLHFDPKKEDATIFNVSKSERRIPMAVGSTKKFWVVDFKTEKDVSIDAKLLYSGKKSEVWVHNNEITTEQAKKMGEEFDSTIYPLVTQNFAKDSDVDGNGKISMLVYDIHDGYDQSGTYVAGYFYSRDLYKTTYSNNSEVFYVDTYPTMGDKKSGYDVSKSFSTIAHELQHMVSYNQNVFVEKGKEMEPWLNEAMSMAAEHMYLKDSLRDRLYYFERSSSIANGHSLLHWDDSGDVLANYSLSYLFGQYLRVQLGQDNKVFKEILEKDMPTKEALQTVIDKKFNKSKSLEKFMSDFRQALYENEKEGLYGFKGEKGLTAFETPLYTGKLPLQLRGGGSIVVPIEDVSTFIKPTNAGGTIDFRLIEFENLDAIAPKKPRVDPFSDIDEVLVGFAKPGSHIQVYKDEQVIGDAHADGDGRFEVSIGVYPAQTLLYVTATDSEGNESEAAPVKVIVGVVTEKKISRLGHINTGKSFIYTAPSIQASKKSSEEYKNSVYYIKKQATYNKELYYLLSNNSSATIGVIGWMKASDVSSHPHVGVDKKVKTLYVKGTGGAGFTRAWGGRKNAVYSDLKQLKGAEFQVNLTEKVGNNIWYRGMLNGKQTWVQASNLTELNAIYEEASTSRLGHINSGKSSIYTTPYNQATGKPSEGYKNSVYYIKKQATFSGTLYYLLSTRPSSTTGAIGWMKASDMSSQIHKGLDKKKKTFYVKGNGGAGYSRAWGGRKNHIYPDLKPLKNELFFVDLTETVGNETWYRGMLAGKQTWIHSRYVAERNSYVELSTSRLGHINTGKSDIYSSPFNAVDKKSSESFKNSVYYIKKQATYNKELYYLLSNNSSAIIGVIGWMKASEVSSHPHVGVDKKVKTLYVKGTGGAGFTRAWGGRKNAVYLDLKQLKNAEFQVNLTEKVGNDTWYRGLLNDKQTWINSGFVKSSK